MVRFTSPTSSNIFVANHVASVAAGAIIRTEPVAIPWYQTFKDLHKARKVRWDTTGLKRLEKGLGLDEEDGEEIIDFIWELLPGDLINAKSPDGKELLTDIASQLEAHPVFGPHFKAQPQWDWLTRDFFAKAAYRFVLVANGLNRNALAESATRQARQVQAPQQAPLQPTPQAASQATPQVPQPLQPQQAALEDIDMQEAPALAIDEEEEVVPDGTRDAPIELEDDDEPIKHEDDDEPAGVAPGLLHLRAPGVDVLYQHMIQVESMGGENFGIASATVTDLFNTVHLPHPLDVTIAALRTFWVDHRRRAHEPANDPTRIEFGYVMGHGLQRINNDATLRFAYRGWLSLNDPWTVWSLVVVNDYDDEYYDAYSDEDEEVDVDRQRVQYLRERR